MPKKKKIPQIVKQIQKHTLKEINYGFEKSISYSQISMFLNFLKISMISKEKTWCEVNIDIEILWTHLMVV